MNEGVADKRVGRSPVGPMLGVLALAIWLMWWLLVPAPAPSIEGPPPESVASTASYLPLDERSRMLPVIWSPFWLPAELGANGTPGNRERLLNVPMDLASPMPYATIPSLGLADEEPAVATAVVSDPDFAFADFTGRHMARPLSLPPVAGGATASPGLRLQVEPPVPDLEKQLKALEDDIKKRPGSTANWNALLILNADTKGRITQVLLERGSGDPDIDSALVRWAYQLSVGPGWDRDFIRLTLTR